MSFLSELQRRSVIRVALGYLAAAWLLIQIVETLFPVFGLSDTAIRAVVIVLASGFVPLLIGSWVFEWTPTGIVRDDGVRDARASSRHRKFDRGVMVVLALAVAYFSVDKFVLDPARDREREEEVARQATSDALIDSFGEKSIVVLPFLNMTDDSDTEYFSDGMTEEILNVLAKIPELRVISRSTSFVFKGQVVKATDVARQLNVAYVLEGSVRKAGPLWRITAQLIDGRSDTHVWSDAFTREFEIAEIFDIQDEIAGLIVSELELNLLDRDTSDIDIVAFESELQARYLLNHYDQANVEKIESLIAEGLAADPDYAPLWWAKSRLNTHKGYWKMISKEEAAKNREEIHARLRILDPDNPAWPLHEAMTEPDLVKFGQLVAKAYNLAPTDLGIVEGTSRAARYLGKFDMAIALGRYLVDRDPLNGTLYFRLGQSYLYAGRYEEAIEAYDKAILFGTGELDAHVPKGIAYLAMGQPDRALEVFTESKEGPWSDAGRLLAYFDLGDLDAYEELLPAVLSSTDPDLSPWVAAWTGDKDAVFEKLNELYEKDSESLTIIFTLPHYMRIKDDPRWHDLMRRLGTTEEDQSRWVIDIKLPPGYEV